MINIPWFKADDKLHSHPKVTELPLEAMGIWIIAGTWCADYLTDGRITLGQIRRLGGAEELAEALVDAGMWQYDGKHYIFKDWTDYQPTKTAVDAEREAARERQRLARERREQKDKEKKGSHAPVTPMSQRDAPVSHAPVTEKFECPEPEPVPEPKEDKTPVDSDESPAKPKEVEVVRGDVQRLCDHLRTRIIELGSKKPRITKAWTDQARLMLDNDKRPEEEAHRLIDWCMSDGNFWQPHIGSMKKFREKYDTMRLQAKNKSSGPQQFRSAAERRYEAGANLVADELSELQRSLGELTQ